MYRMQAITQYNRLTIHLKDKALSKFYECNNLKSEFFKIEFNLF